MRSAECGVKRSRRSAPDGLRAACRIHLARRSLWPRHLGRRMPSGAIVPLLESVEGTPSDDWPASPPLQSLQRRRSCRTAAAALLVGMAGRSHWSASVEAGPRPAALVFDIACRHTQRPSAWLGSRYRGGRRPDERCRRIESRYRQRECRGTCRPSRSWRPAVDRERVNELRCEDPVCLNRRELSNES